MSALICGSMAFDTIMLFPERFRDHILPEKMHILNVSFLVPKMRREFGGVAGNISYNLKLLGGEPYPMGAVGGDFEPYRRHFEALGISLEHVRVAILFHECGVRDHWELGLPGRGGRVARHVRRLLPI